MNVYDKHIDYQIKELQRLINSNRDIFNSLEIQKRIEELEKSRIKIIESVKIFNETLKKLRSLTPNFVKKEWYLREDLVMNYDLSIFSIDENKIDDFFVSEFKNEKNIILERLINENKERKDIINELFNSFELKHYYSCVAISYTLIDGITRKKFNDNFFGYDKNDKSTKSSKLKGEIQDDFFNVVFKSLDFRGEILEQMDKIEEDKRPYSNNRHCVLHGVSYLYGNEVNSIKSIYLLDFISSLQKNISSLDTFY